MHASVEYVKEHVGSDLSFQPELQQKVVKTLLSLLEIRDIGDYKIKSLLIVSELENEAKRLMEFKKVTGKETLCFVTLHECKKAAFSFRDVTDEEADEIKEYLEGLIPKRAESLEQYMSQELGIASKKAFDPNDVSSEEEKLGMVALAMFNSGNLGGFALNPQGEVSDARISEIITRYYTDRGYTAEESDLYMFFRFKKEDEALGINVSSYGHKILVSVLDFRF